jgi:hypothetical protein
MFKIIQNTIHWLDIHSDSLVILSGGLTGALWKANLFQVYNDLCTMSNIEGAIIVGVKAFIGAAVAYMFKSACNYFKLKRKNKNKKSPKK